MVTANPSLILTPAKVYQSLCASSIIQITVTISKFIKHSRLNYAKFSPTVMFPKNTIVKFLFRIHFVVQMEEKKNPVV